MKGAKKMMLIKKKITMTDTCSNCGEQNKIAAEHLTKGETSYVGNRSRYLMYTCPHCGCVNRLVSREVPVLLLRELNDL